MKIEDIKVGQIWNSQVKETGNCNGLHIVEKKLKGEFLMRPICISNFERCQQQHYLYRNNIDFWKFIKEPYCEKCKSRELK